MCGIAGVLRRRADLAVAELGAQARRMCEVLVHRGPDGGDVWADAAAGVAFGHRRLAIIDLSAAGNQPMHSVSGRYVVTLNGEIYNYTELRAALGSQVQYRGHSDTEVLLAAFEAWGIEAALGRAVGMFALGVWDRQERVLTLARDRMGEKPLYYAWNRDLLLFGSELKALRAHPGWEARIDRSVLPGYLARGWIGAPGAIYEDCRKLPAGHIAQWRAGDAWPVASRPYWELARAIEAGADPGLTEAAALQEFERLLGRSVAGQMLAADVPVGAFLSGGIDSSSIVALMQEQSPRPVRTFTIGFQERKFDEAGYARAVAAHLGTDHTELYVTPREAQSVIPRLPEIYDEPFADISQIPTFLVAQLARTQVTVSLSGDGGDELLGGYERYHTVGRVARAADFVPAGLRGPVGRGLRRVAASRLVGNRRLAKLGGFLAADEPAGRHATLLTLFDEPARFVVAPAPPPELPQPVAGRGLVETCMYLDAVTYLPDDILVKVDRAAMAVSLETRVPLLDHRVVEFLWRLPYRYKVRGGKGKWLLRQLLARRVPLPLVERPKMGFAVPMGAWLLGSLRDWAEDLLSESRLRGEGFLAPRPVRALWEAHLRGRARLDYSIWAVLMFQAWLAAANRRCSAAA